MANADKLTKLEVARRQVETAIELFFNEKDPVSIHTLAMAAFGVLRGLSQHSGSSTTMQKLTEWVRPDMEKILWSAINRASNFFKHADRDPHEELEEFQPELNEPILFFCAMIISELGCDKGLHRLFVAWFTVMHPEFIKPGKAGEGSSGIREILELARRNHLHNFREESLMAIRSLLHSDGNDGMW